MRTVLSSALLASLLLGHSSSPLLRAAQNTALKTQLPEDDAWDEVRQHLPNPATLTPKQLEDEGDILRARRLPEHALDLYREAAGRSNRPAMLILKLGLCELELHNVKLAEGYFRQATKIDRRNPQGWNNLAATEYIQGFYKGAVSDYRRAIKLQKATAVYHVNLSTAYFELKDYKSARKEAAEAMRLDPHVYERSSGVGINAHVLSVDDRAHYSFEMAKLYAQHGKEDEMLHALAQASEDGFDILGAMTKDPNLAKYRADPRVILLVATAKAIHDKKTPMVASTTKVPALTDAAPQR
ncbi:MAG TPA: tetratricopeptide repeat protein [Granulicella sp.]